MKTVVQTVFFSPCKSGLREVEAWARAETSPLVVHPYITYPGETGSGRWVVSHKQTGKALTQYDQTNTRDEALDLADTIEPMAAWARLDRKQNGWTPEEWKAANEKLTEFLLSRRSHTE